MRRLRFIAQMDVVIYPITTGDGGADPGLAVVVYVRCYDKRGARL